MEKPMFTFCARRRCNSLRGCARLLSTLAVALVSLADVAKSMDLASSSSTGTKGGVSAVWIFANFSFTGMRAQQRGRHFGR